MTGPNIETTRCCGTTAHDSAENLPANAASYDARDAVPKHTEIERLGDATDDVASDCSGDQLDDEASSSSEHNVSPILHSFAAD